MSGKLLRPWERFSHGADVGVRGWGFTPAEAFEQVAVAACSVVAEPGEIELAESRSFECHAPDLDLLLFDWLNAVVYAMATEHLLFGVFSVKIDGADLKGQAFGEHVNRARHQPAVEIKGATFTELAVRKEGEYWVAQCVLDV